MSRQAVAVLVGVCSLAAPVRAQSSLPLAVDQRVRVETAASTITGRVLAVSPDSLRLVVEGQDQRRPRSAPGPAPSSVD